ncbi:hypothetical protein OIU79_022939 [Salix purpurea]|uniref:Secreted protein n=1 Tax=Salix purpurea TaxID=77065 RepID=A0A9Q1AD48_SALPP|nr:hypothetical protein OIU79_022939 [Salix purpurea]
MAAELPTTWLLRLIPLVSLTDTVNGFSLYSFLKTGNSMQEPALGNKAWPSDLCFETEMRLDRTPHMEPCCPISLGVFTFSPALKTQSPSRSKKQRHPIAHHL